jgi:hypothetical protein
LNVTLAGAGQGFDLQQRITRGDGTMPLEIDPLTRCAAILT